MRFLLLVCALLLFSPATTLAASEGNAVFESVRADADVPLSTDPTSSFWRVSRPVYADRGPMDQPEPSYRTEILSRWTKRNLYFLFICPYEVLNLKPNPTISTETYGLWNWDVAEVFIGTDFENIRHYKEFEISPQGEWIDLDIDLTSPHHEDGWKWNSGFAVAARIDPAARIWYGAMRIPFFALQDRLASAGQRFRLNLFRSQGPAASRVQITWQPTMSNTFHVPEKFGILRLAEEAGN